MRLTIRLKFLLVMSGLLMVCLGFYLLISIAVFKTDKTQLVFDLNRSQVTTLSSEIETSLNGLSETLNLLAQSPPNTKNKFIDMLFASESDVVGIAIFSGANKNQANEEFYRHEYFETYGVSPQVTKELLNQNPPPLDEIKSQGLAVWSVIHPDSPPLLAHGKRILILDENQQLTDHWVIVGLIKLDSFVHTLLQQSISDVYIANQKGDILVQKDMAQIYQRPSMKSSPLFLKAKNSPIRLSVSQMEINDQGWLTAFAKSYHENIYVISMAPEEKVFAVVKSLTVRTLLFGSIVLTLVILAAFLLSRSLTENISLLAQRMIQASSGDLTTGIELKGHDETVLLGQVFTNMIHDLRRSRDDLEEMNIELDNKVKERTHELEVQNRKVSEAREALLHTTRLASMGEIAGQAAHEVLNPLTSLLTRTSLTEKKILREHKAPLNVLNDITSAWQDDVDQGGLNKLVESWGKPSQILVGENLFHEDINNIKAITKAINDQTDGIIKDIKFIQDEGNRIGKIIHNMRRMGNLKSEASTLNMTELLQDCMDIMSDLFEQQNIPIRHEINLEMNLVQVDRDEFIQAITNLMRNSLQSLSYAMAQQRDFVPFFKITAYQKDSQIYIDIEDNGVGIVEDNQDNLFKTHFTTKARDEGTGVGLSISRRLIRSYEGDILFVQSKPLTSTLFRVKLPIKNIQTKAVA
jgi:signal transduction histidine kinase